jgi:hypothetical protein
MTRVTAVNRLPVCLNRFAIIGITISETFHLNTYSFIDISSSAASGVSGEMYLQAFVPHVDIMRIVTEMDRTTIL